jgi:hypothetical protein
LTRAALGDDDLRTKRKGRTTVAKAGLYALGFVLFGVLIIGASSFYGAPYTTSPNPFGT